MKRICDKREKKWEKILGVEEEGCCEERLFYGIYLNFFKGKS